MFDEKHGALWPEGEHAVFEQFAEAPQLFGVIFERADLFAVAICEKVADPQWRLPIWSERRPTSLFGSRAEAIDHLQSLLTHGEI